MVSGTEWDGEGIHGEVQHTVKNTQQIIKVRGSAEQSVCATDSPLPVKSVEHPANDSGRQCSHYAQSSRIVEFYQEPGASDYTCTVRQLWPGKSSCYTDEVW